MVFDLNALLRTFFEGFVMQRSVSQTLAPVLPGTHAATGCHTNAKSPYTRARIPRPIIPTAKSVKAGCWLRVISQSRLRPQQPGTADLWIGSHKRQRAIATTRAA